MRTITFDGTSLNSGNYTTRKLTHDEATEKDLFSYNLTRERGAVIVNSEYKFKKIVLEGTIKGTSADDLEQNIDTFKQLLSQQEKHLDIQYASGTRRYVSTATQIVIARDFYHLNYAPFTVELLISSGVGKDTTSTSYSTYSIELHSLEDATFTIAGTLPPPCTIELEFITADTVTTVEVTINGDKITVDEAISADDVLVIDTHNKKVTLNGTEANYAGRFPRLIIGSNTYLVDVSSTSHQYDLEIQYTKNYL